MIGFQRERMEERRGEEVWCQWAVVDCGIVERSRLSRLLDLRKPYLYDIHIYLVLAVVYHAVVESDIPTTVYQLNPVF